MESSANLLSSLEAQLSAVLTSEIIQSCEHTSDPSPTPSVRLTLVLM